MCVCVCGLNINTRHQLRHDGRAGGNVRLFQSWANRASVELVLLICSPRFITVLVASVLNNSIQIEVKMLLLLPMQSFYSQWISLIGFNWTTWFVLASCAVLAWICWRNSRYVRLINAVPGPKGIPILGNLLELNVGQVGNRIVAIV